MAQNIEISHASDSSLKFNHMRAVERLGEPFRFRVEMLSKKDDVDLRAMLGKPMTVKLGLDSGYTRYFNGIVAEAAQTGFQTIEDVRYASYEVVLVPKPWLLTRKSDCRIYSGKSVPAIIRDVLGEVGFGDLKLSLSADYAPREYCVQYRESYFNFISRLMQEEGIYYFFTHTANAHTMVLADALGAHAAVSGYASLPYSPPLHTGKRGEASIWAWQGERNVNTTRCQLIDYDPMHPRASLLVTEDASNAGDIHTISKLSSFDYPGLYDDTGVGKRYAQVRAEADNALQHVQRGESDACGLSTGALFTLQDFPVASENREYLVVGTEIEMAGPDYASGGREVEPFRCHFEAISSRQPFRNLATAPRPVIAGLQTAVVAGDEAEDIVVDKYGRVQVTFFWNQKDKPNAANSCPVRVASSWAGKSWGAVHIPRVGQEVVVSFLEGNPDRPLIIGSVYNADNMPPYTLPANKTQSGVKSRSLKGAASEFNEFRFEDKKGSEEVYLHAQKDKREEVKHDHTVTIDNDQTTTVKHDQKVTVNNDQTGKVDNNRQYEIGKADTLKVGTDGTMNIGQTFKLEAGQEIELKTGASSIVMKSSGEIEIKGMNITITGQSSVKIDGQMEVGIKAGTKLEASSGLDMKLGATMMQIQGSATTEVKGAMLTLSGEGMTQISGGITMIG